MRPGHIGHNFLIDGPLPSVRSLASLLGVHVLRLRQLFVVLNVLLVRIFARLGREVWRPLFGLVAITSSLDLASEKLIARLTQLLDQLLRTLDDSVVRI